MRKKNTFAVHLRIRTSKYLNSLFVRYNNPVLLRYALPARLTFDARNICASSYSMERDIRQYDLNHIS